MTDKIPPEIQEIDDILSEFSGEFKVRIERLEPRWCDGSLGTLNIGSGEKLDIEELGERYGGRKLLLRFIGPNGRVIKAKTLKFPGPPREDGIVITKPTVETDNAPSRPMAAPVDPLASITPILNMMTAQATAHQKTLETIMLGRISSLENQIEASSASTLTPTEPPPSGLDQIRDSLSMIAEISSLQKSILPTAEGADGGIDKTPLEGAIQDFMKMMMDREKMKMELAVKQQSQATAPPPPLEQPIAPAVAADHPIPSPPTPRPADPADIKSIPNELFAAEVKRRFDQLGDDDKIELMQVIAGDAIDFEEQDPEQDIESPYNEPKEDITGSREAAVVPLDQGGPPVKSLDDASDQSTDKATAPSTADPVPYDY